MTDKAAKKDRRPRGRPKQNEIKPIPATAETIAASIFFAADKKILKPIKNKEKPAD